MEEIFLAIPEVENDQKRLPDSATAHDKACTPERLGRLLTIDLLIFIIFWFGWTSKDNEINYLEGTKGTDRGRLLHKVSFLNVTANVF